MVPPEEGVCQSADAYGDGDSAAYEGLRFGLLSAVQRGCVHSIKEASHWVPDGTGAARTDERAGSQAEAIDPCVTSPLRAANAARLSEAVSPGG
jgi:hypothetical protein